MFSFFTERWRVWGGPLFSGPRGTDIAPPHPETSRFLGLYGGFYDGGESLAPILIGVITKAFDFRIAGVASGCIGMLGFIWYVCLVPETLHGVQQVSRCWPQKSNTGSTLKFAPIATSTVVGKVSECGEQDGDEQ